MSDTPTSDTPVPSSSAAPEPAPDRLAPDKPVIFIVPHFHYDPVWLEDQRTYTAQAFELIDQYVDAARQDSTFKFLLSELDYFKPYWDLFPTRRAALRELIEAGRIEVNGGYNEPNETCIHGEALIRNLLYGRLFQQGILGMAPRTYLPLDVFGHVPQLPQILRQFGFAGCIFSKNVAGVPPLCRAMSLDGSEVIQKHERYWFNPQSWEEFLAGVMTGPTAPPDSAAPGPGEPQGPPELRVGLRFVGMDMASPPRWLLGRQDDLERHSPALRIGLPDEYLQTVEERLALGIAKLPLSSRDLAMYHPGITVSRIELKIANRLAENALFAAERFCTIAWLLGAEYPHAALDKAWRLVMFGQHHDAITGTPSDVPFLDLMAMYREALEITEQIKGDVLDALAGAADTAPPRGEALCALVVFNPLEWERTDICRARLKFDEPVAGFVLREASRRDVACQLMWERREGDGIAEAEIAFVAQDVPALGYSVYHVVADATPPRAGELREADRGTIENEYYSLGAAASAGGGLVSLMDKQNRRQLVDLSRGLPGNEIAALREQADRRQPAWSVFTTGEQAFCKDQPAQVWVERGPAMERIIIEGQAPDCAGRRHEIAIYPGVRRIDFATDLRGYRGEHQLFAALFPFELQGSIPVFEERFGAVARRRSAGVLSFQTFQGNALSGCALMPAQNWMELGNSRRIIARKARGRAEAGFSIGYAAIMAGTGSESRAAGEQLMRALAGRGITASAYATEEDAETDRLHTTFRFRLSVGGDNDGARRLLARTPADVQSAVEKAMQKPGYAFVLLLEPDATEASENDGSAGGRPARMPALLVLARDAAAAEAAIDELAKDAADGVIWLPPQANAVDEVHAPPDDYGVAIINRGNIGASVEADGTAALMLMHTAAWPNHPWGGGKLPAFFIPEHKDHCFLYSLYPHAGDWRRGETTRRAYEANQPLITRQCAPAKGSLPPRHSFLTLQPGNVFVSGLKPRGNPFAMGGARQSKSDSVILRLYEAHGEAARVELSSPLNISQARHSDPLERQGEALRMVGGRVTADIAPYGIETLELAVPRQSLLSGRRFGPQRESIQPLHMRYWEHNLGPAPMGNQPVTVVMEGAPPIGATTRFGLNVANSMADTEAVGMIRVAVPEGWRITPSQVPFRIPPGREQEYELAVIIPPDSRPAYIRAEVEMDGQVYQEVLPVGDLKPVAASVRRIESMIGVTLRNPNADRVQGRVDIITPLETWGAVVGDFALASITPSAQGFDLGPGEETVLTFDIRGAKAGPPPSATDAGAESEGQSPETDLWAYARVASHGHVQYLRAA